MGSFAAESVPANSGWADVTEVEPRTKLSLLELFILCVIEGWDEKGNISLAFCYRKQLRTQSLGKPLDSGGIWISLFQLLLTLIPGTTLLHLVFKTRCLAVFLPTRRRGGSSRPPAQGTPSPEGVSVGRLHPASAGQW